MRQALSSQATRNLIRSGSKRAEALETLTAQVAELQNTLQVSMPCQPLVMAVLRPLLCVCLFADLQ